MFKTFSDFVNLAARTYKLTKIEAVGQLLDRLWLNSLSMTAVECYINWAGNDCMTTAEIGKHLGITPQAVSGHLRRIHEIWPHLFEFGPSPHNPVQLPDEYESFLIAEKF